MTKTPKQPVLNRVLLWVLRSPLSGTVDGSLLLLTLRGRRTGRRITLPVQYAAGEDALWVWPGHPEEKTWWRNLAAEAPVRLRLCGREMGGAARVVFGEDEPAEVERGLRAYAGRFPLMARRAGFAPDGDEEALRAAAKATILVRIEVPRLGLEEAREATLVAGRGVVAAVRRHPLGAFFVLAYAISWGYWIPAALAGGGLSHFPGLLGPMVAAFAVAAVVRGRAGPRELLARMARWRVPVRWYAAALVPAGAGLLALGALALAGRELPSAEDLSTMPGVPALGWLGVLAVVLVVNATGRRLGGAGSPGLASAGVTRWAGLPSS